MTLSEERTRTMLKLGLIGCGHWGPNHVRNFSALDDVAVTMCADSDESRLRFVQRLNPGIAVTRDYLDILTKADVDAVIVSTPASSHYAIVKRALEHDKDVLCEKPLALDVAEAKELVELAAARGKLLMVGHTFLFNVGVRRLKEYVSSGDLGQIHYLDFVRTNLGPIRKDASVVWDLAAHDVSIASYLLGSAPIAVSATGEAYLRHGIQDVAFISLTYPPNILVNIHISWIHPVKTRDVTIVGSKKMVTWDDLNNMEPIKVYDKGVTQEPYYADYGEFNVILRDGDILIPKVDLVEPLKLQSQHFVHCVRQRETPISDGVFGLQVVEVLAAVQKSMANGRPGPAGK